MLIEIPIMEILPAAGTLLRAEGLTNRQTYEQTDGRKNEGNSASRNSSNAFKTILVKKFMC
jgi:hypothetical protein